MNMIYALVYRSRNDVCKNCNVCWKLLSNQTGWCVHKLMLQWEINENEKWKRWTWVFASMKNERNNVISFGNERWTMNDELLLNGEMNENVVSFGAVQNVCQYLANCLSILWICGKKSKTRSEGEVAKTRLASAARRWGASSRRRTCAPAGVAERGSEPAVHVPRREKKYNEY